MERITHDNLVQGSPEWKAHRRSHWNASEASAMLGLSPYTKRDELVRMYATGDEKEFSDYVQKHILDHGHNVEALARPIEEDHLEEGLYPSTFSLGRLSCSTDGLTMDEETAWEHKQWSKSLSESIANLILPEHHVPQCQQIMMITGAKQCLFTVSDGTPDNLEHMVVSADEEWFETIRAGWAQFQEDVDNYQYLEPKIEPVGKAPQSLPALRIEVTGMVTDSNLIAFKDASLAVLSSINTDLKTDNDFATANETVKWCKDVETKLDAAKAHALSQTASIDDLFRAIDEIKEETRSKRLELNKLVTSQKAAIRMKILQDARLEFDRYIANKNATLGNVYMPNVPVDFAASMSGKKTVDSLNNAINTEMARAKIEATAIAEKIQTNLNSLRELANNYKSLFPDVRQIVLKENDDLIALIKVRIAEHQAEVKRIADEAEAKRLADEAKEQELVTATPQAHAKGGAGEVAHTPSLGESMHEAAPDEVAKALFPNQPEKDTDSTALYITDSLINGGIGKQTAKKVCDLLMSNSVANVSVNYAFNK